MEPQLSILIRKNAWLDFKEAVAEIEISDDDDEMNSIDDDMFDHEDIPSNRGRPTPLSMYWPLLFVSIFIL